MVILSLHQIIGAVWVWCSLVARLNGVQEAGSSNLLTQTIKKPATCIGCWLFAFLAKIVMPPYAAWPMAVKKHRNFLRCLCVISACLLFLKNLGHDGAGGAAAMLSLCRFDLFGMDCNACCIFPKIGFSYFRLCKADQHIDGHDVRFQLLGIGCPRIGSFGGKSPSGTCAAKSISTRGA